jgi:hypothetical protein
LPRCMNARASTHSHSVSVTWAYSVSELKCKWTHARKHTCSVAHTLYALLICHLSGLHTATARLCRDAACANVVDPAPVTESWEQSMKLVLPQCGPPCYLELSDTRQHDETAVASTQVHELALACPLRSVELVRATCVKTPVESHAADYSMPHWPLFFSCIRMRHGVPIPMQHQLPPPHSASIFFSAACCICWTFTSLTRTIVCICGPLPLHCHPSPCTRRSWPSTHRTCGGG